MGTAHEDPCDQKAGRRGANLQAFGSHHCLRREATAIVSSHFGCRTGPGRGPAHQTNHCSQAQDMSVALQSVEGCSSAHWAMLLWNLCNKCFQASKFPTRNVGTTPCPRVCPPSLSIEKLMHLFHGSKLTFCPSGNTCVTIHVWLGRHGSTPCQIAHLEEDGVHTWPTRCTMDASLGSVVPLRLHFCMPW